MPFCNAPPSPPSSPLVRKTWAIASFPVFSPSIRSCSSPLFLRTYQRQQNGAFTGTFLQAVCYSLCSPGSKRKTNRRLPPGSTTRRRTSLIVCAWSIKLRAGFAADLRSCEARWIDCVANQIPLGLRKAVAIPSISAQDENRPDVVRVSRSSSRFPSGYARLT